MFSSFFSSFFERDESQPPGEAVLREPSTVLVTVELLTIVLGCILFIMHEFAPELYQLIIGVGRKNISTQFLGK